MHPRRVRTGTPRLPQMRMRAGGAHQLSRSAAPTHFALISAASRGGTVQSCAQPRPGVSIFGTTKRVPARFAQHVYLTRVWRPTDGSRMVAACVRGYGGLRGALRRRRRRLGVAPIPHCTVTAADSWCAPNRWSLPTAPPAQHSEGVVVWRWLPGGSAIEHTLLRRRCCCAATCSCYEIWNCCLYLPTQLIVLVNRSTRYNICTY